MIKCGTLSVDTAGVIADIQSYYISALEEAEDKLIELMQQAIQKTTNGGAPGKPAWRDQVSGMLREVYRTVAADFIEAGVGVPTDGEALGFIVRAMVIAEGSGSAVGNAPITAGPPGRSVWDDDLSGMHSSQAESSYLLPAGFNQAGNHFVDEAVKKMKKHFSDILTSAARALPSGIFSSHTFVTGGG